MLSYMEYLKVPAYVVCGVVVILLCTQFIGEILEFRGKIVPEIFKIRKYFQRKREEKKIIKIVPEMMTRIETSLNELMSHYSDDNITKRNSWIKGVNQHVAKSDIWKYEFNKRLDKLSNIVLSLVIDNKRDFIIDFAQRAADENTLLTREQFNRAFKVHKEYEQILEENHKTNGETEIAYRIITEAYEERIKNHTFLEDTRGYNTTPLN